MIHYFPWGSAPAEPAAIAAIQLKYAEAGDVDAELAIAARYTHGEGVKKDAQAAMVWWKRAAAANDPIAQRMLGIMLLVTDEEPHSWDPGNPGISLLQNAVAQGDIEAQVSLAYWHLIVARDGDVELLSRDVLIEPLRLLEDAARHGYRSRDIMGTIQILRSYPSDQ